MSFDATLNVLGLMISIAGIVVARPTRRVLIIALFSAAAVAALVGLVVGYLRSAELDRVEETIKLKLNGNRWTAERIAAEVRTEDKRVVRDALARAAEAGTIGETGTECVSNDGNVLATRVFYVSAK